MHPQAIVLQVLEEVGYQLDGVSTSHLTSIHRATKPVEGLSRISDQMRRIRTV